MDLSLKYMFLKRPYCLWITPIPHVNCSCYRYLNLRNFRWILKLETSLDEIAKDEVCSLSFCQQNKVHLKPEKFLVTSLVRNRKEGFENIACQDIQLSSTVWKKKRSSLVSEHPDVDFSSGEVTFMFIFDCGICHGTDILENIVKEDRIVQTSPYMDDRPCLKNLSTDLHNLVDQGSNPDVQLRCGDRTFPAHRLILCTRSEVFRAMLQSDMLEGREGSVEIVDMELSIFKLFLEYIYTGILPELTVDIASPLYVAGDKYQLDGLRKRCGEFLAENLTPGSACEILVMADAHNDEVLKEATVSYLSNEGIPDNEDIWSSFSKDHSRLASEVVYRAYKRLKACK